MVRRMARFVALCIVLGWTAGAGAQGGPAFYVAPDGRDSWSGRQPAATGSDGPFATVGAAVEAMRQDPSVRIAYIRGGDYYLDGAVTLRAEHSGIALVAYPGERPVLHGGALVEGWAAAGPRLWAAPLPPGLAPMPIMQLSAAGQPLWPARRPNAGPGFPDHQGWLTALDSDPARPLGSHLRVRPQDLPTGGTDGLWITAFARNGWGNQVSPIAAIDRQAGIIDLATGYWFNFGRGSHYAIFNSPDDLDAPGEWLLDAARNRVLAFGDAPPPAPAVLSGQYNLIRIDGARDIRIEGLGLEDTHFQGEAVQVLGAANVTIRGNAIADVNLGILVERSSGVAVVANRIDHTASHGILLRNGVSGATVTDNWIARTGMLYAEGSGVYFTGTTDSVISHNRIEDTAKFAIAGGSNQGAADASFRNLIEYNDISGANQMIADGGAIMLIGRQEQDSGDVIRFNRIAGTTAWGAVRFDGSVAEGMSWAPEELVSWAIYLDDFASGIDIYGNLLLDNVGGILVHAGRNNRIVGNVIAGGTGAALGLHEQTWVGAGRYPVAGNLFERNIVWLDRPGSFAVDFVGGLQTASFGQNLYAGPAYGSASFRTFPALFGGAQRGGLAGWQALGMDAGAMTAEPGFLAPASGDYRLDAAGAAAAAGFGSVPAPAEFGPGGASHYRPAGGG